MNRKMIKPKMEMDWDTNRRIVTGHTGEKYVLFKDRAKEVYDANLRIYKKFHKK